MPTAIRSAAGVIAKCDASLGASRGRRRAAHDRLFGGSRRGSPPVEADRACELDAVEAGNQPPNLQRIVSGPRHDCRNRFVAPDGGSRTQPRQRLLGPGAIARPRPSRLGVVAVSIVICAGGAIVWMKRIHPKGENMSVEEILGTHRRARSAPTRASPSPISPSWLAACGSASIAPTRALTPGASSADRPTLTRTRSSRRSRHAWPRVAPAPRSASVTRITMSTAVCLPRNAAGASAPAMTCSRRLAARDGQPDTSPMCADRVVSRAEDRPPETRGSLGPPLGPHGRDPALPAAPFSHENIAVPPGP
jgi:hypothetical protein